MSLYTNTGDKKRVSANEKTYDNAIVSTLNDLIMINHDAVNGYRAAADAVEDETYRRLFRDYATQRENFIVELSNLVVKRNGKPSQNGHYISLLHRAWMNIKSAVGDGDNGILAECDKGEEVALETYRDAMKKALPDKVRNMIRSQMSEIRMAHQRIHSLNMVLH